MNENALSVKILSAEAERGGKITVRFSFFSNKLIEISRGIQRNSGT